MGTEVKLFKSSDNLRNLSVNGFWASRRRPAVYNLAILVNQELLEVPLREMVGQHGFNPRRRIRAYLDTLQPEQARLLLLQVLVHVVRVVPIHI